MLLLYPFWVGHSNSVFLEDQLSDVNFHHPRALSGTSFLSWIEWIKKYIICGNLKSTGSLICFYNLYTNLIHRNEALWWCNIEPKFTFWTFLMGNFKSSSHISIVFKLKPYFIVALLLWYTTKWSLPHHVWPPGGGI